MNLMGTNWLPGGSEDVFVPATARNTIWPEGLFVSDKTIRIGENPAGQKFELDSVIQL